MANQNPLKDIEIDAANLYREETVTDLKVGNIRIATPIKPDGSVDESRTPIFSAVTNIMTPGGALPISGEIEATTLAEAIKKFPETINQAVKQLQEDMLRLQQEQASRIVTPDQIRGKGNLII